MQKRQRRGAVPGAVGLAGVVQSPRPNPWTANAWRTPWLAQVCRYCG